MVIFPMFGNGVMGQIVKRSLTVALFRSKTFLRDISLVIQVMKSPIYISNSKWRQLDSGREEFDDAKQPQKINCSKNVRKSPILDIAPYTKTSFFSGFLSPTFHFDYSPIHVNSTRDVGERRLFTYLSCKGRKVPAFYLRTIGVTRIIKRVRYGTMPIFLS